MVKVLGSGRGISEDDWEKGAQCVSLIYFLCTDAIKTRLTAMVDLVPTAEDIDDLDDNVVDTLRAAGVLSFEKSSSRKGKGKAVQATPRHIVFVETMIRLKCIRVHQ
ncbi:hypothetical protein RSOL_179180 [Rhizoctonia solani AG-3 Rhs1AP]|uniref:Uncharacterized protein n=2 Tax=Rhizoctonia solani AG-3 TaxID=1086053 RepID=A0A074RWI9_9AGAM|nr:hypothetical protein RSOL_179180 [Rhizoctonia solani AG-3 Rhs1AP]KEP51254.1 hypothetical protein V565_064850 [Rhizoctonia solani 123E]